MATQKGITLTADVAPGLPILRADGRRLMRALENLVKNAVQHGVERVEVAVSGSDAGIRFEVQDDGHGFVESNGEIVLGRGRDSRRQDSAGIGLVVTQRVAEAHGGTIGAANLEAGGAAVWFTVAAPDAVE